MVDSTEDRIVRINDALTLTGLGRSTFYDKVKSGAIPKPLRLGARAVGWRSSELRRYLDSLPRAA